MTRLCFVCPVCGLMSAVIVYFLVCQLSFACQCSYVYIHVLGILINNYNDQ